MKSPSDSRYDASINDDCTVTLWDVFRQQWRTLDPREIDDETLATLSNRDREEIDRAATLADEEDADREDCESERTVREYE